MITGIISFTGLNGGQSRLKIILYSTQIIIGLFQVFFPKKAAKIFIIHDETISINDKIISWKLNRKESLQTLDINQLKKVKIYNGEVHFETYNNDILKLSSHKIQNKVKYEEFVRIINNLKTELDK